MGGFWLSWVYAGHCCFWFVASWCQFDSSRPLVSPLPPYPSAPSCRSGSLILGHQWNRCNHQHLGKWDLAAWYVLRGTSLLSAYSFLPAGMRHWGLWSTNGGPSQCKSIYFHNISRHGHWGWWSTDGGHLNARHYIYSPNISKHGALGMVVGRWGPS